MNSLLDTKEFAKVKENILLCKDGKEEWKADFIEFANDDCDNSDLSFFFDCLPFVRFLVDPSEEHVAFTTPNQRIYLNAPYVKFIGESKTLWEAVYFHECLHQLWDTFGVAKEIKKTLGEDKYDHALLNIASDCVINEFIMNNMHRKMPSNLIDAKYIKDQCGVEYERAKDTQFSLYCKLLDVKEKVMKNMPDKYKDAQQEGDPCDNQSSGSQSQQGGQQGQQGKGGQGGQGSQNNIDDMSGEEAAKDAQKSANQAQAAADAAQKAADAAKEAAANGGDQKAADKAQEAADKAKEAADKAQEAADDAAEAAENGDDETAKQKAKEARDAANQAKQAANEAGNQTQKAAQGADGESKETAEKAAKEAQGQGQGENGQDADQSNGEGNDGEHDPGEKGNPSGTKQIDHTNGPHTLEDFFEEDNADEETNQMAKENLDNYKKRIDGITGEFIGKIKNCFKDIEKARDGKGYKTFAKAQGASKWDLDFKKIVDAYIKNQISRKKREMEPTYARPNRRAGYVKYGEPIKKGVKVKEDKLNISMTFYIDKSGSMWGEDLDNATKLAYGISDAIEGKHKHEKKVIDKFDFGFYTFNENIQKIKKNQKVVSDGGNMSFEELLDVMKKHSINDMINVIITDAGFPINVSKTVKFVEDMNGLFVFVTNMNQNEADYREVEKKAPKHNFKYILADRHFDLHEDAGKL